ncbi:hypothetical protein AVEN_142053-1 [Araneus ventricosus]|uniref:Uncharacterized protein n=1 Tax=Araneus ventricosus TaxID=182803 RepID=A0A4Y2K4V6_ARAVE|nr:hypothetical protein AVEN_142053-1 [Araneus ventricosus]
MLPSARKEELRVVAEEIGETVTQEMKIADLRKIILGSKAYKNDPESVENFMNSILEARKRKEEQRETFELENKLEFEKIKLKKSKLEAQLAKMDKELELERISLEKEKIRNCSREVSNSTISASVFAKISRNSPKLAENYVHCVPGVSSNMILETSRITNEIRADPLTIPEEEMGFRGHCPVDWYTENFTALVPLRRGSRKSKTSPLREDYLEEEKNCVLTKRQAEKHEKEFSCNEAVRVDSGFVEEKVSGAVVLSPHRVSVSAVGHVVELRKGSSGSAAMLKTGMNFGDLCSVYRTGVMRVPGSGWSRDQDLIDLPLDLENISLDCLRYSDEGGECDAASFVEIVEDLFPSHINDELEAGRSKLLMTTEEKPIIMWELDPGISRMFFRVYKRWKPRNSSTCTRQRDGGGMVIF